eukprot:CAMPEP_0183326226 /NCGR_PEP_ID=MMETSP0160_2-20130417/81626_1 /TAXON_ID=2839 ORGANISM="Odontella Sinensis, Strain Grunow 1884" /NCGR_SAMPLE_ID=MMETSP0160_2 /ASSEMBLY_ACC=CAM_ASM_000250 /LENGTH=265 /DNA_ID=CAMNT_0025494165 /DNA_START=54 /DNA_END=851 /DNA_ORIENTATION=-
MNEARDSPARRKQFLVICTVMASVLAYTALTSGLLETVVIEEGTYPGGTFLYKTVTSDPAATAGIFRVVSKDLGIGGYRDDDNWADLMYAVYLDGEEVPVGMRRFFGGTLVDAKTNDGKETRRKLMDEVNNEIKIVDDDSWLEKVPYEEGKLPRVKAGVTQFPFTNGFVSALIHTYKVNPIMERYAREHGKEGEPPIVSVTCSVEQQMCTHYAILEKQRDFLLGRPDSAEYMASKNKGKKKGIDYAKVWKGVKSLSPFKSASSEL